MSPIIEIVHNYKNVKNDSYIKSELNKSINSDQYNITLDPKKVTMKVYTSTDVFLYDRTGNLIQNVNGITIKGHSEPQYNDNFNKYEGRKLALLALLNCLKLKSKDKELIQVKQFLKSFELKSNIQSITYEFMDLWIALVELGKVKQKRDAILIANYYQSVVSCFEDLVLQKSVVKKPLSQEVLNCLYSFIEQWDVYFLDGLDDLLEAYEAYKWFVFKELPYVLKKANTDNNNNNNSLNKGDTVYFFNGKIHKGIVSDLYHLNGFNFYAVLSPTYGLHMQPEQAFHSSLDSLIKSLTA